jgi:hypothetical protein
MRRSINGEVKETTVAAHRRLRNRKHYPCRGRKLKRRVEGETTTPHRFNRCLNLHLEREDLDVDGRVKAAEDETVFLERSDGRVKAAERISYSVYK